MFSWKNRHEHLVAAFKAELDKLRDELKREFEQQRRLRVDAELTDRADYAEQLVEVVRTKLVGQLDKQQKQLLDSLRNVLFPGFTMSAPAGAWFLNSSRPEFPLPNTVIDVGVGRGTSPLYQAYPLAYHLLIEPIEDFSPDIERILTRYNGAWARVGASNVRRRGTVFMDKKLPSMSSLSQKRYEEARGVNFERREVELVPLDQLVAERTLAGPYVIKTDVEGHDLEVLEGASQLLDHTLFVISECRADSDFTEPTLDKIVKFLHARSFNIVGILDVRFEKDDSRLRYANLAFANDGYASAVAKSAG